MLCLVVILLVRLSDWVVELVEIMNEIGLNYFCVNFLWLVMLSCSMSGVCMCVLGNVGCWRVWLLVSMWLSLCVLLMCVVMLLFWIVLISLIECVGLLVSFCMVIVMVCVILLKFVWLLVVWMLLCGM